MRKISRDIAEAFRDGRKKSISNSMTDGSQVFLHGNRIAWKLEDDKVAITLAGWPTPTTRERLNAILDVFGWEFSINQVDGNQVMSRPSQDRTRERVLTIIEPDQVITMRRVKQMALKTVYDKNGIVEQAETWKPRSGGWQSWEQPPE